MVAIEIIERERELKRRNTNGDECVYIGERMGRG